MNLSLLDLVNGRVIAISSDPFEVPLGQRQLFLDSHGISRINNLNRTMHQPDKRGAVIEPDQAWESLLQIRCAPVWDRDRQWYKIWLISAGPGFSQTGIGYAESRDGVVWTKPLLNQVERNGSKKNNLIALESILENVVYDPHATDAGHRFKGLMGFNGRQPVVSPDGIHWTNLAVPGLLSEDESNLSYDLESRQFIATLKQQGPYGRAVTVATSEDFKLWTKPELVFHTDAQDQVRAKVNIEKRLADPRYRNPIFQNTSDYNADVYNMGVFRYEGVYIGLPAVYHAVGRRPTGNTDGFHLIQLAMSRDLKKWIRLGDRQPFIGPSPVGADSYDTTQLLPPSAPVAHGDELWFYYTGIKFRHVPEKADPKGGAICLATLRRDGFVSLDGEEDSGTVLTKPFKMPKGDLHVNVDSVRGMLRVDVLANAGGVDERVVARSNPVTGDQLGSPVTWSEGTLSDWHSKRVSLRFTLRDASFYSYWFTAL